MVAEDGDLIFVTDRDQVIAEIHKPISPHLNQFSRWESFLNQEYRSQSIIRAKRRETDIQKNKNKFSAWPKDVDWKKILEDTRIDR